MGYTWAEFHGYLRRAHGRQARDRLQAFVFQNLAFAGGSGAQEVLRTLKADAAAAEQGS